MAYSLLFIGNSLQS